jgi:membrane-associated phospholipid phosphatase
VNLLPRKVLTLPRHPGDVLRLLAGLAILLVCTATVRPDDVGTLETDQFRLVNDLPDALFPAFWVVMQAGNVLAVGVVAAVVAATRRFWLAANLAITGIGVWLAARWIKDQVGRGRPADLLSDVHLRGHHDSGLGFVSGHAAVAVAIATMIVPYLGRRARWVAVAVAVGVCLSRMYVGAHLPLDVVGGAALGWAAGSLVHLLLGAPGGRPSPERAAKALAERGLQVTEVTPLGGRDARRSARFQAVGPDGQRLFAKLIPRERRDEDLLYRLWRMLVRRRADPGRPGSGPPAQQVEREAYLGLLAGTAGVRTPRVVLAGPYGNGSGLLVQRMIPGRSLEEIDPAAVDDATLQAIWVEVARLHRAGIAHGDLGRHSVVVDDDGRPWLVDFDHATAAAPERLRQSDLVELLVSLAASFGPDRALAGAVEALGRDPLAAALAAATPAAFTQTTREELGGRRRRGQASIFWPFPMMTTPPSETTNRSRSRSRSTPILAPSGTWTFLSRMALRTTAPRPMSASCISTDPSTLAPAWTLTPGDRTERRTVPPDTTTPAETIESSACPVRPSPSSNTNLAGGRGSCQERIGQRRL